MQTRSTLPMFACLLAVAALTSGCGIFKSSTSQASSESSSDSSSSPFRSSSASSGGDSESELAADVRNYSAAFAASRGDEHGFRRTVGQIARSYGVFDWEADPTVHRAMGSGFRQAGLDTEEAMRLGATAGGADQERLAWVLAGYEDISQP